MTQKKKIVSFEKRYQESTGFKTEADSTKRSKVNISSNFLTIILLFLLYIPFQPFIPGNLCSAARPLLAAADGAAKFACH